MRLTLRSLPCPSVSMVAILVLFMPFLCQLFGTRAQHVAELVWQCWSFVHCQHQHLLEQGAASRPEGFRRVRIEMLVHLTSHVAVVCVRVSLDYIGKQCTDAGDRHSVQSACVA